MGRMSKQKGSSYELETAKMLTEWWGGGNFSRVPASGGLHWADDQRVAGDIIPPPKADFPFVIECKKREEWTIEHILLDIGQPREWWSQVVTDARRVKLVPLLMFSRNRAKNFIMLPYTIEMYEELSRKGYDTMVTTVTFPNIRKEPQVFEVIVTTYETFTQLSPDTYRQYAKGLEWDALNPVDEEPTEEAFDVDSIQIKDL